MRRFNVIAFTTLLAVGLMNQAPCLACYPKEEREKEKEYDGPPRRNVPAPEAQPPALEEQRPYESFTPTGGIIAFVGETAPDGWLLCDGQRYSSLHYPGPYDVIQTRYVPDGEQWILKANEHTEVLSAIEKLANRLALAEQNIESLTKQLAGLQREKEKEPAEDRSRKESLNFPLIPRGYERIYKRFLNGRLIYKPNKDNDIGKLELRIADLTNPLDGTFDLSQCGDTSKYLSISTGYRKEKKAGDTNKVEIWFTPRFLVKKEINGSASHFKEIFPLNWPKKAAVGIIWTWGNWDDLGLYDYLTTQGMKELGNNNLLEKWCLPPAVHKRRRALCQSKSTRRTVRRASVFYIHFMKNAKDEDSLI